MLIGVINAIKEYLIVGLITICILCLLYYTGYYLVYKKILHGKKSINNKKAMVFTIFITYIFLVLVATVLGRFSNTQGGINLELFSSYKKAIFLSNHSWRDITLNIIMFIPLGFLLPLLSKVFYKSYFTLFLSFCFTLGIEVSQLRTKIGAFDVDDIFNNFLGSIIGYCLIMTILSAMYEKKHKTRKIIFYVMPLIIIVIVLLSYFIY